MWCKEAPCKLYKALGKGEVLIRLPLTDDTPKGRTKEGDSHPQTDARLLAGVTELPRPPNARSGRRAFHPQAPGPDGRMAGWPLSSCPSPAQPTALPGPVLPSQWEASSRSPAEVSKECRLPGRFLPPARLLRPHFQPLPPAGSHLNACRPVCSATPSPTGPPQSQPDHREVGSGFTKGPRRGSLPLAGCLARRWGRVSAGGSGERDKGQSPGPHPHPAAPSAGPLPLRPGAGSRGPPGPGGTGSGRVGVPRGCWWQNILDWGGARGILCPPP